MTPERLQQIEVMFSRHPNHPTVPALGLELVAELRVRMAVEVAKGEVAAEVPAQEAPVAVAAAAPAMEDELTPTGPVEPVADPEPVSDPEPKKRGKK